MYAIRCDEVKNIMYDQKYTISYNFFVQICNRRVEIEDSIDLGCRCSNPILNFYSTITKKL